MKAFTFSNNSPLVLLLCTKLIHNTVKSQEQKQDCPIECFHNGKCVLHESTGQYYCQCPSLQDGSTGFQGIHCEESYIQCTDGDHKNWRCHNYGTCNLSTYGCDCPPEFDGSRFCETYIGPCNAENGDFLLGPECSSGGVGDSSTTTPSYLQTPTLLSRGESFGIFIGFIVGAILLFVSGMKMERWRMRSRKAELASQETPVSSDIKSENAVVASSEGPKLEIT